MMQQMLQQQAYEAALAQQQQQQMKSTVSAGAINLMQQQQVSDCSVQPPAASSHFAMQETTSGDQLTALRRASEGQVLTTGATMSAVQHTDSASRCVVTSIQPQSTDAIPAAVDTATVDSSASEHHDETTFKIPFPPDQACCQIFGHLLL